jgi:hypothetical protein
MSPPPICAAGVLHAFLAAAQFMMARNCKSLAHADGPPYSPHTVERALGGEMPLYRSKRGDVACADRGGADGYISEPVEPDVLESTLRRALAAS